ncbi:COX assembly mitochondrial protein homolog isoform X1 [Canis lupus familiaris]|uniref:COX assembly mitochondrial protein homolog isoform X1 n=1 Tax=Canis lupus familiaris TaxID=9615 RepID=UPI0015F1A06C|nr:COX assembly mitochondrial protein homolog isoform X1 [Canis lupus familiaris]
MSPEKTERNKDDKSPAQLRLLFLPTDQAEAAAGEEGLQAPAPARVPADRSLEAAGVRAPCRAGLRAPERAPPPKRARPRPLPVLPAEESVPLHFNYRLRGGARGAQAQWAAEVATRGRRRQERGRRLRRLRRLLRLPREAPGRRACRPLRPLPSPPLPAPPPPGSGQALLSSPPAEMALDPAEQHLRHVEKDVLIPKIMREKARERCSEQVQDFTRCCKDSGILMVVKCRKENSALKECLTAHYNDPAFYEECKMEYLKEREEFRKTGIPSKKRLQKLPTSM